MTRNQETEVPGTTVPRLLDIATFLSFIVTVPIYLLVTWRVTTEQIEGGRIGDETWEEIYGGAAVMGVVWLLSCRLMLWWIAKVYMGSRVAVVFLALYLLHGSLVGGIAIPIMNQLGELDMRFPFWVVALSMIYAILSAAAAIFLMTPAAWRYYRSYSDLTSYT